ncbi:MAG: hypothetical protein SVP52_01020 [Chloroflexota bacterium]|nr:hypothetical protein [Chloroflexota bacterium]
MKKLMKSFVILAVVAIALGSASAVFAQTTTPDSPVGFGSAGIGSRGNGGGRGNGAAILNQTRDSMGDGLLHDAMIAAFSEALGIPVDDLEVRLANGETLADIAISTGLTFEDFRTLLNDVRTQVHEEAAEDGLLPGSQSGWIKDRRSAMGGFGARRGGGQGQQGAGDCPYYETID